jgi:hypothetical protein
MTRVAGHERSERMMRRLIIPAVGISMAFSLTLRRDAIAAGTLSGDVTRSLGRTRDAGLSSGRSAFVEGDC